MVYEHKWCLNWFVARYTGFGKSTHRGFFSNVGSIDSQEDSASAISPGLFVSLVDMYVLSKIRERLTACNLLKTKLKKQQKKLNTQLVPHLQ